MEFIDISTGNVVELPPKLSNTNEPAKKKAKPIKESSPPVSTKVKLKCPECPRYTASDEGKLTRHIRKVHRGENPYQCFMCDYSTYNSCLFEEHVRIHKGIKPFKCSYCPHRNVSKKNLKRHEKIHRPDNPLKCLHCNHVARHKKGLDCHMKTCPHSPVKVDLDFSCSYCNKVFTEESASVLHKSRIRTCNVSRHKKKRCSFTTCSLSTMRSHKETEHGAPKRMYKARVRSKKQEFKCSLCEWTSNKNSRILLHLIHHPNQKVDEKLVDLSILRKHGIIE